MAVWVASTFRPINQRCLNYKHEHTRNSMPTVSVSRWLTQPCPYGVAGSSPSTADVSIWGMGLLEVQRVSKLALLRRLIENSTLARLVLNSVRTELLRRGSPSSLYNSSSLEVPALASGRQFGPRLRPNDVPRVVAYADFNNRFKHHSDECKEAIRATNSRRESRDIDEILAYKLHCRHKIPCKTADLIRANLPPMCIEGRAPLREAFGLERPKASTSTYRPLIQVHGSGEGSTSISVVEPKDPVLLVSISSLDIESSDDPTCIVRGVEIVGRSSGEIDVIRFRNFKKTTSAVDPSTMAALPAPDIPLVPSYSQLTRWWESIRVHPSPHPRENAKGRNSRRAHPRSLDRYQGRLEAQVLSYEIGRQVTVANSARDHDTSVAFVRAVMLPNDVVALFEETSNMMRSLLVMQHVQIKIMTDAFGIMYLSLSLFLCF
ncbi:hypothetical protein Acr_07g0012680 [Actinidia rufa]|uniref:Uncharacterized protein n=1 Tax=Actinidia rufa TaxID=165716 RepID=A0A7J0EXC4_9ERIC|nr:hypothetical protein Acr_07g0012680 [Actinidia rufa]